MRALLNSSENARLKRLLLALPLLGAVDALGLAVIIMVFLHIVGIQDLSRFHTLVQRLSTFLHVEVSERTFGLTLLILIALARFVTGMLTQYLIFRFCYSVQTRLSAAFLASFLASDLDFIAQKDKAFGVQIVFNECARYSSGILLNGLQIAYEALTLVIYLAILLYANVRLSLFFIVATALAFFLFRHVSENLTQRLGRQRLRLDGRRLSIINEAFQGFQEVASYGLGRGFVKQYQHATSESLRATIRQQLLNLMPKNIFEILMVTGLIGVAFFTTGPMPQNVIATLAILLGAAFRCMPSINRILSSRQMMSFEMPVVTELLRVWRESERVKRAFWSQPEACRLAPQVQASRVIRVPAIHFSRAGHGGKFELNVEAFDLRPTDIVLIMGESGSGKSTYLGCVAGLLTEGLQVRGSATLPRVSYAPQAAFILNDTLEANITLAAFFPGRAIDRARVVEAARVAQLIDPVGGMPVIPFDKVLDGSGGVVSGGQRQRIALARALYFESDLLILDEITSGLDEAMERMFIESYRASPLRRATLFVTHRSHLASSVTQVYRLQNGTLV